MMAREQEAAAYVRRIRNKSKQRYAVLYARHLFHGGPEPRDPEGLAYMAVQGVRLQLAEIRDADKPKYRSTPFGWVLDN